MEANLLDVRDFSVSLEKVPVISNLSFAVQSGEFLTILGPNGSGKTVLLKALLGLLPHTGELKWRGKPRIGYLPQGFNQISVRDLPLTVTDFFGLKKIGAAKIPALLELVGIDGSVIGRKAGHLSGGEFQRMLVAWVLASNPDVLFLDEPTTAIDAAGGETIYSLLKKNWQNQSLTILNVTHDLNIVYAHSTHVLCLSRFGHKCFGVPKDVLTPDVLHDLYGTEVKLYSH